MVQAVVDTGAQRSALHSRRMTPGELLPSNDGSIRGLAGVVLPKCAKNLFLKTSAGHKNLEDVPVFDYLQADLLLGVDFLM